MTKKRGGITTGLRDGKLRPMDLAPTPQEYLCTDDEEEEITLEILSTQVTYLTSHLYKLERRLNKLEGVIE